MNAILRSSTALRRSDRSGGVLQWVGLAFLVGSLYVLSLGPAVRLSEYGLLSKTALSAIYWPLGIVRGTPLQWWLNAYVAWWLPRPFVGDLPTADVQR